MALQITANFLRKAFPNAKPELLTAFVGAQAILDRHGITASESRLAFFFAQLGHESRGLQLTEENMNYTAKRMTEVWPKRYPTIADAQPYAKNPRALANHTYGSRMGNRADTDDGWDYRGSGPIQITGREGFREVGWIAKLPLEDNPDLARDPKNGPAIAAAFWTWKKLNPICDAEDFIRCTKTINGGLTGMVDRQAWLRKIEPLVAELMEGDEMPLPDVEPVPDAVPTKPAIKSTINWAAIGAFLASLGGLLTDWRVVAVIVVGLLAGYIVVSRKGMPDIGGWFRS